MAPAEESKSSTNAEESTIMMAQRLVSGSRHCSLELQYAELVNTSAVQRSPENFGARMSAFVGALQVLDLTASEELDLFTKWPGKEGCRLC